MHDADYCTWSVWKGQQTLQVHTLMSMLWGMYAGYSWKCFKAPEFIDVRVKEQFGINKKLIAVDSPAAVSGV